MLGTHIFRPSSPGPLTDDWKFTDALFVTFQLSISGPGEFGHSAIFAIFTVLNRSVPNIRTYSAGF